MPISTENQPDAGHAPTIKICGLTSEWDVFCTTHAGIQGRIKMQAGFIYGVEGGNVADFKKREKGLDELKRLINKCRSIPIEAVVVTDLTDPNDLKELLTARPITLQLSGDVTADTIRGIKRNYGKDVRIIKTIHIGDSTAEARKQTEYWNRNKDVNAILFDSCNGDKKGGTGEAHDWDITWQIFREVQMRKPYGVAGGLNAGNVAEAIIKLRPAWVDVDSGTRADLPNRAVPCFTNYRRDQERCLAFVMAAAPPLAMAQIRSTQRYVRQGAKAQRRVSAG